MKYKLLKQIEEKDSIQVWSIFDIWDHRTTLDIDIPECQVPINFLISQWYIEEVKEPKTIYDLKKWDTYWWVDYSNQIDSSIVIRNNQFDEENTRYTFVTEREAKRNKLLRELATRDKWLPDKWWMYYTVSQWCKCMMTNFTTEWDILNYHSWLVFRNEEEYDKWMTPEVKDLLFNI